MPVLGREPSLWPETLFDGSAENRDPERWRVFHVRPRAEKMLARRLRSFGVSYFLPQYESRKRYQRRLVCSHLPLFPGYLFVVGDEVDLESALAAKELVRTLPIDDQHRIERELRDIHLLLQSGQPVTREDRLRPGSQARIIRGPLAGLCGLVVRNKRGLKFVLRVEFLQQGVSLEVDSNMIEAI